MRVGHKPTQAAKAHDDTAPIVRLDRALAARIALDQFLRAEPVLLGQSFVDRDNDLVAIVGGIEHIDGHLIANLNAVSKLIVELGDDDAKLYAADWRDQMLEACIGLDTAGYSVAA